MNSDALENVGAAASYARTHYGGPELTTEQLAELQARRAAQEARQQRALENAKTGARIAAAASPLAAAILELHSPVRNYRDNVVCSHCDDISDYAIEWPCATAALAIEDA